MFKDKLIVCFNCGHSELEKNFSMRVLTEDVLCPSCGEVLIKKPQTGQLPGFDWNKKKDWQKEYIMERKRYTNRLGAV